MMRILSIAIVLLASQVAQAGVVNLTSTAPDLTTLQPGDVVTFSVELSGLGGQLDFLGADVVFDDTIFGAPVTISSGPIVPSPAVTFDPYAAFIPTDTITAFFDNFPGPVPTIASDGVFYSFDLPVIGLGAGDVSIVFADGGFGDVIALGPGSTLGAVSIPEPSSWLLVTVAIAFGGCVGVSRRRRRRSAPQTDVAA
jgi:hypothetical protein